MVAKRDVEKNFSNPYLLAPLRSPYSEIQNCPRCGAEAVELDTPVIQVGKTRQMRVSVKQCPKCLLVFMKV